MLSKLHCAIASRRPLWFLRFLRDHRIKGKSRVFRFYEPNRMTAACQQRQRWIYADGLKCKLSININEHVGYKFFTQGKFDDTALSVAQRLGIGPENILIDVGANIGTITIPVCLLAPSVKVLKTPV